MSKKITHPLVGIDISSSSVKVAQVSKSKNRYKLEAYAIEPLSPNSMQGYQIADADEVSNAIVNALKKAGIKSKSVATLVRVGDKKTTIWVPESLIGNDDEVQAMVEAEVSQTSGNLDDVRFDFKVLEDRRQDGNVEVNVAIAQRNSIEIVEQVIEAAGLKLELLEVEANVVENGYEILQKELSLSKGQVVGFFDLGHSAITLRVLKDGLVIYSRSMAFDSNALVREFSTKYGISVEEALNAFKTQQIPEEFSKEVIPTFREHIKSNASRLLQYYQTAFSNQSIGHFFLVGAAAKTYGLAQFLDSEWGTTTVVADLTSGMDKASGSQAGRSAATIEFDAPSLFTAIALAASQYSDIGSLNLMPWREELKKVRHAAFARVLGAVAIASLGLIGLGWFLSASQIEAQSDKNTLLENEISEMKKKVETIQDLDIKRERLLGRKKVIEELQSNRSQIVHLFDQLVRTVPNGIQLSSIKQTGGFLINEGRSESSSRVSEYMSSLEASPWIEGVDLQIIEELKDKNSKLLGPLAKDESMPFYFKIKMKISNPNVNSEGEAIEKVPEVPTNVSTETALKGESLQEVPEVIAPSTSPVENETQVALPEITVPTEESAKVEVPTQSPPPKENTAPTNEEK